MGASIFMAGSAVLSGRKLLVQAIRHALGLSASPLPDFSDEAIRAAAETAANNKVLGELSAALQAWTVNPPIDVMGRIANYRSLARFKARQVLPTLDLLNRGLTAKGIAWVAYKGHALQAQLGRGTDVRSTGDLDILVARADFDAARECLVTQGMSAVRESEGLWWTDWLGEITLTMPHGSGVPVDLHYRVQQPGCPQPINAGALLQNPAMVAIADRSIPTLSPINAAINCAICIVKSAARLEHAGSHIYDFADFLLKGSPEFDRDLLAAAERQKLTRTIAVARFITGKVLDHDFTHQPEPFAALPDADWARLMLDPVDGDRDRLRRRSLLWALCDGPLPSRAAQYAQETYRFLRSERVRLAGERGRNHAVTTGDRSAPNHT